MERRLERHSHHWSYSRDTVDKAFRLAYILHPHKTTAALIVQDSLSSFQTVWRKKERPIDPEEIDLQLYLFAISEDWEKVQELPLGPKNSIPPIGEKYCPTSEDLLVRYVKFLARRAIEEGSFCAVVGLGNYLYRHGPLIYLQPLISRILPQECYPEKWKLLDECILGTGRNLEKALKKRFSIAVYNKLEWHFPSSDQANFISDVLKHLKPWGTDCLQPGTSVLDLFLELVTKNDVGATTNSDVERTRVHALVDPECGGIRELIRAHDSRYEPVTVWDMRLPSFTAETPTMPNEGSVDRFNPELLNDTEVNLILDASSRAQDRRRQFCTSVLQIYADGEKTARVDPLENPCASLHVSALSSHLEVYGQDDEGFLLLAVFPLNSLRDGNNLRMRLESGQRLRLSVRENATTEQFEINLSYKEAPHVSPAMLMRYLREWTEQLTSWLAPLYRRRWVPVGSTCLILILLLSTAWWGILWFNHPKQVSQPEQSRGSRSVQVARFEVTFVEDIQLKDISNLVTRIEGEIIVDESIRADRFYVVESKRNIEEVLEILNNEPLIKAYRQVKRR